MSLMTVDEVAEFLGVKDVRVIRLEREHLLQALLLGAYLFLWRR